MEVHTVAGATTRLCIGDLRIQVPGTWASLTGVIAEAGLGKHSQRQSVDRATSLQETGT